MPLPEMNPETGHSLSCKCRDCQEYFRNNNLRKWINRRTESWSRNKYVS